MQRPNTVRDLTEDPPISKGGNNGAILETPASVADPLKINGLGVNERAVHLNLPMKNISLRLFRRLLGPAHR